MGSSRGGTTTGSSPTRESSTSGSTSTFHPRLCPTPLRSPPGTWSAGPWETEATGQGGSTGATGTATGAPQAAATEEVPPWTRAALQVTSSLVSAEEEPHLPHSNSTTIKKSHAYILIV